MANEHSFDINASVDFMEIKNALESAKKEVAARDRKSTRLNSSHKH